MKRFLFRIKRIVAAVHRAIFSKWGVIATGTLSGAYLVALASLMTIAGLAYGNPSLYCGSTFHSYREEILVHGIDGNPPSINADYYGTAFRHVESEVAGRVYQVYVSSADKYSNFLAFTTQKTYHGYGLTVAFYTGWIIEEGYNDDRDYAFHGVTILTHENGTPFKMPDILQPQPMVSFRVNHLLEKKYEKLMTLEDIKGLDLDPAIVDTVNAQSDGIVEELNHDVAEILERRGVGTAYAILNGLRQGLIWCNRCTILTAICAAISLVGSAFIGVFLIGLVRLMMKRKEKRLLAAGLLSPKEETVSEAPTEDEALPRAPPKKVEVDELPLRPSPLRRLVEKTHLHPLLGEWFFRGFGLAMLIVGAVLVKLVQKSYLVGWSADLLPLYRTLQTMGSFILVIALVGIIAETRQKLTFYSALFFTLAVAYYFTVNSIFLFFDNALKIDVGGMSFASALSSLLPGNFFLSIGLFTFIGFFLFEEPPEWFINRKVFRALSAIPASIALVSVVFSVLRSADFIVPTYWIGTFFFVRDFDGLFVGVLFEFAIFVFRSVLTRRYGKNAVDDKMEDPTVQFQKNIALCVIVLVYVGLFYAFPGSWKKALSLPDHTFVYVLIPVFLFYRPAGRNRNAISNVIYYILYAIALAMPMFISLVVGA